MSFMPRSFTESQRFIKTLCKCVAIARVYAALNACAIHIDRKDYTIVERDSQRLRSTHAPDSAGDHKAAFESAAEMNVGQRGERLKGPLQNALRADVDPAASGHLTVHHETFAIELVKVIPVGPLSYQIRIREYDTRSHIVRWKHCDWLTGLN
jgi:hypothetical protein